MQCHWHWQAQAATGTQAGTVTLAVDSESLLLVGPEFKVAASGIVSIMILLFSTCKPQAASDSDSPERFKFRVASEPSSSADL